MPISVKCHGCDTKLKAPDKCAGKKVKCPKCGGVISVPVPEEEPLLLEEVSTSEEPPSKTAITSGRRQKTAAADDDEQPARKSRRHEEDHEDEEPPPKSRRRRQDDDDEDDEKSPRRRRRASAGLQAGLGIASLSLAVLLLLALWIPALNKIILPLCGIAFVLGLVGLCIAIAKGAGHGFPIAGCEVSGIAAVASFLWIVIIPDITKGLGEIARDLPRQNRAAAKRAGKEALPQNAAADGQAMPPVGAAGELTLANGIAQLNGTLAATDPIDPVQQDCHCKVYTLNMSAGRSYQIDMMSAQIDSFLRLENPEGQTIISDDDSGEDLDARIVFTCDRAGVYRIVATSFVPGTGSFSLRVQER
jgi:hypothetical protein